MGSRGPASKEKQTIAFRVGVRCPSRLEGEARTEFKRVVRILTAAGVPPQEPDADAIERYARAAVKERQLFTELETAQWITEGDRGGIKVHPLITAWRACNSVLSETAAAFGFTPAARSRIPKSGATGKSDNPFKAFISSPTDVDEK